MRRTCSTSPISEDTNGTDPGVPLQKELVSPTGPTH